MFLGLGFALGGEGFGVIELGPHDQILEIVATLTLSLVLFLDATKLQLDELGRRWLVPFLVLVPGTGLIIVLGAVPLALLFGLGWTLAFTGGAILASTDPVVLREILRDERIPRPVRQVLKIEAGMNDIVVLPVILVLIALALGEAGEVSDWVTLVGQLLLIGPAIGLVIGGAGAWLIGQVDSRTGVRRDYQALYGIGLVLASYATATAAGGDGFLAAFAAGLAVILVNQDLCDCFLEYGEFTSEMAMLFAFVLFGTVLSSVLPTVNVARGLVLAGLVIFVIRPAVLGMVLSRARMSWEAHAFVAWFGPRGLNSLLLALLVVQNGVPGSELLFAVVGVVVLASVTVHGASSTPIGAWYGRKAGTETLEEERESTAAGLFEHDETDVPRVSRDELSQMLGSRNPPMILDVRSRSSYVRDGSQIPGSVRVPPDRLTEWLHEQPEGSLKSRLLVTYCT